MTIDGTVNKTALGLLLLMTTAIYSWNNPANSFDAILANYYFHIYSVDDYYF
jgi:uncharacterized YccA/Bax inhibitor family protein